MWTCSQCNTTDTTLQYGSGKMKKCRNCQRFHNMRVNANRERKNKHKPKMEITEADFLTWSHDRDRVCRYCGIRDEDVGKLKMKTQIGLGLDALGIDRLDSDNDYKIDNIDFCCFACNKAKGDVFTDSEMRVIGEAIKKIWAERIGPCQPPRDAEPSDAADSR